VTVRLTLVRHGKPAGAWGDDPDPGLDPTGREQAAATAELLAPTGPCPVIVSPLRRTRETAAPLLAAWAVEPAIEPGVGELAAPIDLGLDHQEWLRAVMAGRGADHPEVVGPFRDRVLGAISAIPEDSVVVTHFLAINAVVGSATGDDRVVCFAPGHCSRTVVEVDGDRFRVLELGQTGDGTARL
jgi:broad specificity phosphatase PhoE